MHYDNDFDTTAFLTASERRAKWQDASDEQAQRTKRAVRYHYEDYCLLRYGGCAENDE